MHKELFVITGGVRSGKSLWAQKMGEAMAGSKAFIATAQPLDKEMDRRIKRHQEDRAGQWKTFEEPKELTAVMQKVMEQFDVVLLDCLTLWISNLLTIHHLSREVILQQSKNFVSFLQQRTATVILVTNEVGMGIIPGDSLSRSFQDLLGNLNREVAAIADYCYLMVSGNPLQLKPKD